MGRELLNRNVPIEAIFNGMMERNDYYNKQNRDNNNNLSN